jgi:TRAP-type C4-dicarboxylate transport system permease small subunit
VTRVPANDSRAATATLESPGAATALNRGLRRTMDGLYWLSAGIAGVTLVLISVIIPWGVYTRYVLDSAASWPEPAAILLSIVLTFFGAAACYRANIHMRITVLRDLLPPAGQRVVDVLAELLVAAVSIFMIIWGVGLCQTTWYQSIDEFPWLRVGITYLPIPIGGVLTVLFVIERILIGPPPEARSRQVPDYE